MALQAPTWRDTLHAALSAGCACVPCLAGASAGRVALPDDDDDEQGQGGRGQRTDSEGRYVARRARADELEGLLADAGNDDDAAWGRGGAGDAAADADAISLHSHLGPRGRRRVPPKTPRHISLWGWNLFGSGRAKGAVRLEGEEGTPGDRRSLGLTRSGSTTDLLASAAQDAQPRELTEADVERRAQRRARKEMRRMAKAVARSLPSESSDPPSLPGTPGYAGIPAPFLHVETAPPQPQPTPIPLDDDDEADLDGLSYARRAPRLSAGGSQTQSRSSGRSSGSGDGRPAYRDAPPYSPSTPSPLVGAPPIPKTQSSKKSKSKSKSDRRSTRSKSSATSSTLASPSTATFPSPLNPASQSREDFGGFVQGKAREEFDGTPGGFDGTPGGFDHDDSFDGTPGGFGPGPGPEWQEQEEGEAEVVREALPSAGLSSGRARMGSFNGKVGF
ncbi:hypothetical protein MIND_01246500 [Mycena indigotica]|uniref:Uncharacterized protein n=1 Tax=Mycena indigotica TaxID=2126181 RepID=A0A8H6S4B9_9AGAR|nr:uncharacterized protein MIND_01246500 [Mycena indigotica]KAF7292192.1 hypothetical protein MIND_01246500 [Mycena indigotica]